MLLCNLYCFGLGGCGCSGDLGVASSCLSSVRSFILSSFPSRCLLSTFIESFDLSFSWLRSGSDLGFEESSSCEILALVDWTPVNLGSGSGSGIGVANPLSLKWLKKK